MIHGYAVDGGVLLSELLERDRVRIPLQGQTKDEVLRELVELATQGRDATVVTAVLKAVRERERWMSTGIGGGIAIPHGKTTELDRLIMAAGVTREPIEYDALDGRPVQLFFLLVGPERAAGAHVKALSRISRLMRRGMLREDLRGAATEDRFLAIVRSAEAA